MGNGDTSTTFCVLPWMHRFTNIGGEAQVCCTSDEYNGFIRDEAGMPLTLPKVVDDDAIMNSGFMARLRTEMLDGKWPTVCERCRITESVGGRSRRNVENKHYEKEIPGLLKSTHADGKVDLRLMSVDFRLGNLCNLACRMCNPRSSTSWLRDWPKVDQDEVKLDERLIEEYKSYHWYQNPSIAEQLKKQAPHLRHLHFAGGEPLLVPEMISLLQVCVDSGHSEHIELSYNTNITRIPAAVKTLWPRFAGVKLLCSIDGFGAVNDLIRHPSTWSTIDANLRDLERNFKAYGLKEVLVSCTVQVYNVFRLRELYDYLAESFRSVSQLPNLIDLHHPVYYRSQILPPALKATAKERLEALLARSEKRVAEGLIPEWQACNLDSLRGVINFLTTENHESLIPVFQRAASSKDAMRNQRFYEIIPELRPLAH